MEDRQAYIDGLKQVVEFLAAHPEAPLPYLGTLNAFVDTKEELSTVARHLGGSVRKDAAEEWFYLAKSFGPIDYHVNIARDQICEKVVIGTKTIPAMPERTIPATEETVEEIFEWRCGEVLS